VQVTHAEEGFIHLLNKDRLLCLAQKRFNAPRAEAVQQDINDRLVMRVIEGGQAVVLTPEQLGKQPNGPVSLAYAPLVLRNKVIGVLGVRNVSRNAAVFSKHHSALLSALTDYAAIAIENSHNFDAAQAAKERENTEIRNTFKRFVPPMVVDEVLKNPAALQLGGKRRIITVMFADIRGYTAWSENAHPEQVIEMLNDYLSLAANVIMSYNGTLDKYMGDGLMALFNAPEDQPNHVQLAAEAALMLQQAARELESQRNDGLTYSIGMSMGEAIVGYIGTESAVNFTAVGDAVNLAKRLQEYAPPGHIVVEQSVIEQLGQLAVARPLGEVKLKGRQKQAYAYELTGLRETSV
jgi:class 3 adenylate cyclase